MGFSRHTKLAKVLSPSPHLCQPIVGKDNEREQNPGRLLAF